MGSSGGEVEGIDGSSGIKRRGMLGAETNLERGRDGDGEDNTVLDGDSSDESDNTLFGGILNGKFVGGNRGGNHYLCAPVYNPISSSSTNTPTGTDVTANSHTWSARP